MLEKNAHSWVRTFGYTVREVYVDSRKTQAVSPGSVQNFMTAFILASLFLVSAYPRVELPHVRRKKDTRGKRVWTNGQKRRNKKQIHIYNIRIYMYTVYQINKHIWLVVSTPLKNMKVSWEYYSQYMGNMFQTTNQICMTYEPL